MHYQKEAEITHAFIFPGASRLKPKLAELLTAMPETAPVVDRLGAQDATSDTHLLRIDELDAVSQRLEKVNTSHKLDLYDL